MDNSRELKEDNKKRKEIFWLQEQITKAADKNFYGKIVITFHNGRIRQLVKEECLKPPAEKSS